MKPAVFRLLVIVASIATVAAVAVWWRPRARDGALSTADPGTAATIPSTSVHTPAQDHKGETRPSIEEAAARARKQARYGIRNQLHWDLRSANLSEVEAFGLVNTLFVMDNRSDLLASLRKLCDPRSISKRVAEALLVLMDRQRADDVRDAILEVLLYAGDEAWVVEEVMSRYQAAPIRDATYRILAAFPANEEMLDRLVVRFESRPMESRAAADALATVFLNLGTLGSARLCSVLTAQLRSSSDADTRESLVYSFLSSRHRSVPEVIEAWWITESSEIVRRRALDAMTQVGPENHEWAKDFLRRQIASGLPAELEKVARASVRNLTPPGE